MWKFFSINNDLKWIITSISENCPSPFELEVLNSQKVKTILWSYSFYGFRPTKRLNFKNYNLLTSFSNHKYILMWDKVINDNLKECEIKIYDDNFKKFYLETGPVLNGTVEHLEIDQSTALAKLKIFNTENKFFISIFDLVAWKKKFRISVGMNPFMTEESQDLFYEDLLRLLDDFPNLYFLFKPKRGLSDNLYLPKVRELIINGSLKKSYLDRIFILEEGIDPVLVIKASNFVITSFFTSPSMIAYSLGIPSIFYEPNKNFNFITPPLIQSMLVPSYEELKDTISKHYSNVQSYNIKYKSKIKSVLNEILSDRTQV